MNIVPVITPQIQFTDRNGNHNAYLETNPSLFINEQGEYILLVRLVNYRKFKDRSFAMYENKSKSLYYILRGKISESGSFCEETCKLLKITTHLPKYETYWLGGEDIRFIDEYNVLVTYPELSKRGKPIICKGRLDKDELIVGEICSPCEEEKNWMPFILNGTELVIYSVYPFIVKDITKDFIIHQDNNNNELKNYHGSTNGIKAELNNEVGFLFLVHKYNTKNKSIHKLIFYNPETHHLKISKEFIFFSHSYIEFPCSLVRVNNKVYISMGVNDDKAYIISMNLSSLMNKF